MACVAEVLGLTLPGCATSHAVASSKKRLAKASGKEILRLIKEDIRPSSLITPQALENAVRLCAAVGGSTNALLHLPALAGELGLDLGPDDFDRLSKDTPHLTQLKPAGPYTLADLDRAGGVPGVIKRLLPLLHAEEKNLLGQTMAQVAEAAVIRDDDVIRPLDNPVHAQGSYARAQGPAWPRRRPWSSRPA